MFSPPPKWSVTGMALLWKARSSRRPPPPTWSTNGTSASQSCSQNGSRSGCVGARSPAAGDDRLPRGRDGPVRVDEGDEPDRQQTIVGGAELRHREVLRPAPAVEAV